MSFKDLLLDATVGMDVVDAATAAYTVEAYRGTPLIRNRPILGPYSRTIHRALWWSWGELAISDEQGSPVAPGFGTWAWMR